MRAYELMVIFTADTDESSIQTFVNRLEKMANESDGTLEKLDKWGVRRFAYEMNKAREGFYVVLEFLAPNAMGEIDRTLRLADEVIRHKFIRLPLDEAHRRGLAGATA
ncbi:MAG: 30S ribosomal protein S6 [Actinomycetota bacterium]